MFKHQILSSKSVCLPADYILTTIEGVDFEEAWPRRMGIEIEGVIIPVIGRKHLIENKRALGRSQDLADMEHLSEEDS